MYRVSPYPCMSCDISCSPSDYWPLVGCICHGRNQPISQMFANIGYAMNSFFFSDNPVLVDLIIDYDLSILKLK